MKSWGIKRRVLFLALVPAAAIAIVLAFFFTFNHIDDLERSLIDRGTATARHLAPAVEYGVISGNRQALETLLAVAAAEPDVTAVTIRNAEGQILASRGSAGSHAGHQITAREPRMSLEQDAMVLVFSAPVLLRAAVPADLRAGEPPEEKVVGRVYVELSKASLIAKKNRFLTNRLAVTLLGLAGAAMLALRMSQDVTRPISGLAKTVEELGRGNLEARVVPNSGSELLVLQKGVNKMAAALQEGRETLERRIAQATQALAEKKEEAERANAAKSRFLAAASHDLRQPMHALHLFVGEMRERAHAPETRQIVGRIESSVAAMEEMLDALLDISRLDAGALEPQVSVFPVTHLFERMRESFAPAAREQGLKLRIAPCKLHIRSDPLLLERILLNLVSNALRYTPRGKILVGCRRRGASVRIEVRDSGIGIPQQELRNIFQEFYQLSGADRDRAKGLGLGLAIVDRLARLLGYELHVASTPGKGSLFAVEVPRAQASAERQPIRTAAASAASWVLIVDDDPLAREAMARLLASWNWEVLCAGSGADALTRIASHDEPPAAIICDFHLSETEKGIELIERVREHFSFGVPAILVSGDSSPRTLKQARAYGCPLLLKPLRPAKLRALLAHLLSERAAHG